MSLSANDLRNPHQSPMFNSICEAARAKVNLILHIKGKRRDGYHELESLVVFADVRDELVFTPTSEDKLSLEGPFAGQVDGENLVLKAKRAFASFRAAWRGSAVLQGFYVWNWYGVGGTTSTSYTPRGKPAELEIRRLLQTE